MFPFSLLGVASAGGIVAIVVLVGIVWWRRWTLYRRARSRPASPEVIDHERREALRAIAAADYARRTRTKDH
jgi:hypothetical protein